MRVVLFHNQHAGYKRYSRAILLEAIETAGHYVTVCDTDEDEAIDRALREPTDLIAIAGGDGSVRKVALRLVDRAVPIALLPAGTANNISTSLGITAPFTELIAGWESARRQPLNVVAIGPWGEQRFLEGVGLGVFADMMCDHTMTVSRELRFATIEHKLSIDLADLLESLETHQAIAVNLSLNGRHFSGPVHLLEALNIKRVEPGLLLAPYADASDGFLDVVSLCDGEMPLLAEYLSMRIRGGDGTTIFPTHQARSLLFECDGAIVHIDDTVYATRRGVLSRVELTVADEPLMLLAGEDAILSSTAA